MTARTPTAAAGLLALAVAAPAQMTLYLQDQPVTAGDNFGKAVADAGDVDGDGHPDYIVGSPFDSTAGTFAGAARVFSGRTGALVLEVFGESSGDTFGQSVSGFRDFDGDGRADVLVGAPFRDNVLGIDAGKLYLISGATGAELRFLGGNAGGDALGWSVAGTGDMNLDGTPDFLVGAPLRDLGGSDAGRAWAFSGATWAPLWSQSGQNAGDKLGWSVGDAGDIDGDGRTDAIVGAPGHDALPLYPNAGIAYVWSGTGSWLFARSGGYANGQLGFAVDGAGDFDADGTPDVVIGEPFADANGADAGRALVISGGPQHDVLLSAPGWTHTWAGYVVAGCGDLDGIPGSEVLVAHPMLDFLSSANIGVIEIHGISGVVTSLHGGLGAGDSFGWSADVIDVNLDGQMEVVAGAPFSDSQGSNGGHVRVIFPTAVSPNGYCVAKVNSQGCTPGLSYTGAPSLTVGDNFRVGALNVLNNKPGMLIWGFASGAIPFGGGTLCITPPTARTALQSSGGSSLPTVDCSGTYDFNFSHGLMAAGGLAPGQPGYAQYWSRDPGFAAPQDVGLTNGIRFDLLP